MHDSKSSNIANEPLLFLLLVIGPKKKKKCEEDKTRQKCDHACKKGYIPNLNKVSGLLFSHRL